MAASQGYFSLIQYAHDPERLEAVNVGVILLCPDRHYVRARTSSCHDRVRRLFGKDADLEALKVAEMSIVARVDTEASRFRSARDLEDFAASRANEIQITPPRSLAVDDPDAELERLLGEFAGGRTARASGPARADRVTQELERAFDRADVAPRIRRGLRVEVPARRATLDIPYGYQNGRFHLVQPVDLGAVVGRALEDKVCRHGVDGYSLYRHEHPELGQLRLVVVMTELSRPQEAQRDTMLSILRDMEVYPYFVAEAGTLAREIAEG